MSLHSSEYYESFRPIAKEDFGFIDEKLSYTTRGTTSSIERKKLFSMEWGPSGLKTTVALEYIIPFDTDKKPYYRVTTNRWLGMGIEYLSVGIEEDTIRHSVAINSIQLQDNLHSEYGWTSWNVKYTNEQLACVVDFCKRMRPLLQLELLACTEWEKTWI